MFDRDLNTSVWFAVFVVVVFFIDFGVVDVLLFALLIVIIIIIFFFNFLFLDYTLLLLNYTLLVF